MFIPMCIGNTKLKPVRRRSIPVYPYVYREHLLYLSKSPIDTRFIPMCIGNTQESRDNSERVAVYPYVYREHTIVIAACCNDSGLSLCV